MADPTAAERMRRMRRHAKNDHSLCLAGHCAASPVTVTVPAGTGEVTAALAQFLAEAVAGLAPGDTKLVSAAVARTLAERIDRGDPAMSGMCAQLRAVVGDLAQEPGRPGDGLDAVKTIRHQRRLESLLAQRAGQAAES